MADTPPHATGVSPRVQTVAQRRSHNVKLGLVAALLAAIVGGVAGRHYGNASESDAAPLPLAADTTANQSAKPPTTSADTTCAADCTNEPASDLVYIGAIQKRDLIGTALARAQLSDAGVTEAVAALNNVLDFRKLRPGHELRIERDGMGRVTDLTYKAAADQIYRARRDDTGKLTAFREEITLERGIAVVTGFIEHSLWDAMVTAGESPEVAEKLAQVFEYDIDFNSETQPGDAFRFYIEKFTHNGDLVRYGRIHAAEYMGGARSSIGRKQLYWYENAESKIAGYFDAEGKAARRTFLRSPIPFTRVSSGFGYRRHPIFGKRHFHGGIDLPAPVGTPVRAVAEGTVVASGTHGGAGQMVTIRHPGGYESSYLHLSKRSVKIGERVAQGDTIGKVGNTGNSTGPHLDFRLKLKGKYINPLRKVAPAEQKIVVAEVAKFKAQTAEWVSRMQSEGVASFAAAPASRADLTDNASFLR